MKDEKAHQRQAGQPDQHFGANRGAERLQHDLVNSWVRAGCPVFPCGYRAWSASCRAVGAPPAPRTRQPHVIEHELMCSIWASARVELAARPDDARCRGASRTSVGPSTMIISRSITLRSSRTLPGHVYRCSAARLSFEIEVMFLPNACENSSTNAQTRAGCRPSAPAAAGR